MLRSQLRPCSAQAVRTAPHVVRSGRGLLPKVAEGRPAAVAAPALRGRRRAALVVCAAAAEPFRPERPYHKGVVDPPDPEPPALFGFTFSDFYYALNITYWTLLLASVLTGSDMLGRIVHFEHYTTAMFVSSALFTVYHIVRFARDLRQHLQSEARRDWRLLLRYCWNAMFWSGFVLWYAVPPLASVAEYTGTPGAVMCLFGAALAAAAALQVGQFSFMGSSQVPRRLHTGGIYALLRHPQALGNMLFLIGFSLAGGALWASLAFCAAFALYIGTVVPLEERMLQEAFGDKYERYVEKTPRFAWALMLLLIVECVLMWRFQPWAVPIDTAPVAMMTSRKV